MTMCRKTMALATAGLLATMAACEPRAEQQEVGQEGGQAEAAAVDTASIRSALDSVRSAFAEAFTAGEISSVSALLHPEVIYSPAGAPPIRGRDSVIAYDQRNFPPGATLEIEPIDTRIIDDEWVFEIGTTTVSFTPEGAEEATSMESTYLVVLRNTGDGWKLYREVAGSNQSPQDGS